MKGAGAFAGNNPATTTGVPNEVSNACAQSGSGYDSGVLTTLPSGVTGVGSGPDTSPVPEPGSIALLSSVLLAIIFVTFRKRLRHAVVDGLAGAVEDRTPNS